MKKLFIMATICTMGLLGCSEDDKEEARLKASDAVEIGHDKAECPKADGLYKQKDTVVKGLMAFNLSAENDKFTLISSATPPTGKVLIVDGKYHEEVEGELASRYVAGCDDGVLEIRGHIGEEKIDMRLSDASGGQLVMDSADGKVVFESVTQQ